MTRIIDLTMPLADGLRGVSIEPARTLEKDGWNATTLHLYSHCGTHMDAPTHFAVGEQTIDQIRREKVMTFMAFPLKIAGGERLARAGLCS